MSLSRTKLWIWRLRRGLIIGMYVHSGSLLAYISLNAGMLIFSWYTQISLGCAPEEGYEPSTETSFVVPFAISAFIGDLRCLGLLSFEVFETCVAFLLNRIQTPMHLRCLRILFSHAGAYNRCGFQVSSLFKCHAVIRKRAAQFIGIYTVVSLPPKYSQSWPRRATH